MATHPQPYLTFDEYLVRERQGEIYAKLDLLRGQP